MIPKDWKEKCLHEVALIQTGIAKGKQGLKDPVALPYLRVANVQDGYLDLSEIKTIEVERKDIERFSLRCNDILLTEGGDFDKLGRGTIWSSQIEPCLHQNHVFAVRPDPVVLDPYFFSLQASGAHGRSYFLSCAKRSTNLASINSTQLKEFPTLIPPIQEQRKISSVISCWEKAITTTESLIAAKQKRKQALMQQLLTSKKRLRGFKKPWLRAQIDEVLEEVKRPVDWSDDDVYELISMRRRSGGAFLRENLKGSDILTKKMNTARAGDFLISKMQVVHGAMGLVPSHLEGKHISDSYIALVSKNPKVLDIAFFDWISRLSSTYRLAYRSSYGVHIEKMTFNIELFMAEHISIPNDIAEQRRIVAILDSADREIQIIKQKKAALEEQKKGLMGVLLTGKKRVKA